MSFVDAIHELLGPLLHGVPTVLIPDEVVQDPLRFVQTACYARGDAPASWCRRCCGCCWIPTRISNIDSPT